MIPESIRVFKSALVIMLVAILVPAAPLIAEEKKTSDWFFPEWAGTAKYNQSIKVRDTDSALGRYSLKTKEVGLKDIALFHGHLCDGMVIAYVEIKQILSKLFPDGIVDRTDLRVVSKNGPCWIDTVAYMTGSRINFQTLRVDNSVGDGFIIQRISTGETYSVHLKPGVFPKDQAEKEAKIRQLRADGKPVTAEDINDVEKMADDLSAKLLNTHPEEVLEIRKLANYRFVPADLFGNRGDIINKDMPR
jgi:formylmethanofuran dehydrogenase subunit E